MKKEIDMDKFKAAVIKQIRISDEKNQIKENMYEIHIKQMWDKVVNDIHTKISGVLNKKTITKREAWIYQIENQVVIESLKDSFNEA